MPIATIAGRLGHSRNSTTLDMYTKAIDATDEVAAHILAGLLDGPPQAQGAELDHPPSEQRRK